MILTTEEIRGGASSLSRALSGVYAIRNGINQKCYVGSAVSLARRFYNHVWHLERGTHRNPKLLASWRKNGAPTFTFEVLEVVANPADLVEREQYWIDRTDAAKKGYNICAVAGSSLGCIRDTTARQNIAKATAKAMADPETKVRHSAATRRAVDNPDTRERTREAARARWRNPETRRKQMEIRSSPAWSEMVAQRERERQAEILSDPTRRAEHSQRMKAARRKQENEFTPEQLQARRDRFISKVLPEAAKAKARHYRIISPTGETAIIHNLKQFCRDYNVPYHVVMNALVRQSATSGGYRFERLGVV
jgi:group I intron endonuclease